MVSSVKLIINTRSIYWLIVSFFVFELFFESISPTLCHAYQFLTFSVIVLYYLNSKPTLQETGKFINTIMVLLLIWSSIIIYRGNWDVSSNQLIRNVISSRGVVLYLLPFIFFLKYDSNSIKSIFTIFFYASLLSFPLWILNWNNLNQTGNIISYTSEGIGGYLQFFAAFLLFISPVLTKRKKLLIMAVVGIYLVLMLINGRRNVVFSLFLYGCISYLIFLIYSAKAKKLGIVIFTVLSLSVLSIQVISNLDNNRGVLSFFFERFGEDTRSGVTALYFYDFQNSPKRDFIIGRGMSGTYYFNQVENRITGEVLIDRPAIETGYLDMILKGGLVFDILIILVLIPGIFKGLKSKQFLGTACGLFLLTYLIDLYSTAPISNFGPRALLFWFCISICYRKERYLSVESFISN